MRNTNLFIMITIMSMIFTFSRSQTADPPVGSGTLGSPYQIATLNNLYWVSQNTSSWNKQFIQTANIDASSTVNWTIKFPTIGRYSAGSYFSGTYNGNGFVISGIHISGDLQGLDHIGLFTGVNGSIRNLGVINATVSNLRSNGYAGILIGMYYPNSTSSIIENCYSSGIVTARVSAGGLIGASATASTSLDGVIRYCYSTANVYSHTITPTVAGYWAGFIGSNRVEIIDCYAKGSVTAYVPTQSQGGIGGFAGVCFDYPSYGTGSMTNCYSTGLVTKYSSGTSNAGGFLGRNGNSYSGYIIGCFWDTQTSGLLTSAAGTGKTTSEMKTQSTFTGAGWNFSTIWAMIGAINDGYPYLKNNAPPILVATWNGAVNSDWNIASNWDVIAVPGVAQNVIIPDVTNDPVIASSGSASCNNLTINSGASLTVNSGGSLITAGVITNDGTINVQQILSNDNAWHFISMPNNNTVATTFLGMYLQQWNEPTAIWSDIIDTAMALLPVQGYSLWCPATKLSFTYTGTPNTGNQSMSVSYTSNGSGYVGANLMGNPYPSWLDWSVVLGYGAKYTWNGTGYDAYTTVGGYGLGSRYVAPMEGFFVVVNSGGTFSLNNTMRTHQPPIKKSIEDKVLENGVIVAASNGVYNDELWIIFEPDASENFELERDAWKLISNTESVSQLWSVGVDGKMAVDVRSETETIQLGFSNDHAGIYSISLKDIESVSTVILEDTKENIFHDLSISAYEFAWNVLDSETRFILHLNTSGINANSISSNNILIYTSGHQMYIKGLENGNVTVSDLTGRTVLQQQFASKGSVVIPVPLQSGIYLVAVTDGNQFMSKKIFIK